MEYIYYKDISVNIEKRKKSKSIFIITFCSTKIYHESFLKLCVDRIRLFHSDSDIVILNDSPSLEITTKFDSCVQIEKTKYKSCGEINAYVWACEHIYEYDNYIFIHDSVFLVNRINYDMQDIHFRPLWISTRFISDDTFGDDTDLILEHILIKDKKIDQDKIINIRQGNGSIVFGSMGIFNNVFVDFLRNSTNFMDIASMFHTRKLRSFFERVIYIYLSYFYDVSSFNYYAICGDILEQNYTFMLSCPLYSTYVNNSYALKVWQGR
jgi:hypothetical protein